MLAGERSYRSTSVEYVAENTSVSHGSLAPVDRGYRNLFLALLAPGPRHPPRAAPKKPEQSKDREIRTCGAPHPFAVRIRAVLHGYRGRRARRGKGSCRTKWAGEEELTVRPKWPKGGKEAVEGKEQWGGKRRSGYRGSRGKCGSKGHMDRDFQAHHRTW